MTMSPSEDLNSKGERVLAAFRLLISGAKPVLELANVPFANGALEIVSDIIEPAEVIHTRTTQYSLSTLIFRQRNGMQKIAKILPIAA